MDLDGPSFVDWHDGYPWSGTDGLSPRQVAWRCHSNEESDCCHLVDPSGGDAASAAISERTSSRRSPKARAMYVLHPWAAIGLPFSFARCVPSSYSRAGISRPSRMTP